MPSGEWCWNVAAATRTPVGETSRRQYFFVERMPSGAYGVHHVYAPIEKVECQVENEDPELTNVGLGDPILLDGGTYRSYATCRNESQRTMLIGIWESEDAVHWHPRKLGQVERHGMDTNLIRFEELPGDQSSVGLSEVVRLRDGRWRMYFWKHREGHLRCTIAESEDGLRWRVPNLEKPALYHPADGGLWKLAEGLTVHETAAVEMSPQDVLERKRLWSNDSSDFYYNEHMDRYECYSVWLHPAIPDRRVDVDNAPGVHRMIQRRVSEDGLEWSDAELILMPDDRDPWDLQFYFLAVQWHEDWMIGKLGYYRVEDEQQSMDTDLCFSRDGRIWERPVRGGWIPRSEAGSGAIDTAGIYAPNAWVDLGGKWLALYQGTPQPHNSGICKLAMMGATFAKNRFVGLAAGSTPGGFFTDPFFPPQEEICVDADIRGWLRAELCDGFGRKLPGFHLMDSVPLSGNNEAHTLRWKDSRIADHRFECLRLRFEFSDGVIYGLRF